MEWTYKEYLRSRKTVCEACREVVNEDDFTYVMERPMTHFNPEEGHLECPHCREEVSIDYETFKEWGRRECDEAA